MKYTVADAAAAAAAAADVAAAAAAAASAAAVLNLASGFARFASMASTSKTSVRVAATIEKYKIHDSPIHIDPEQIGADWTNRMGSTPNIAIVHNVLAESFKKDGYDPSKPQIGLCRNFAADSDLRQKLLAWNLRFSGGDPRFPAVHKDKMENGSLACTHLNMCARLFKQEATTISGLRCSADDQKSLQDL